MALTKAQVSLVTVATLGAAPGGFTADLLNFGSQVEVAALALSVSPTQAAQTNAEFVNQVVKNLGTAPEAKDKIAFLKALDEGTSRAEAAVDFANLQLVSNDKIANVDKAIASTSTSTILSELMEVVTPVNAALTVDLTKGTTATGSTTTITSNIGKKEIDAGAPKKSADYTFELKNQIGEDKTFEGKFLSPVLDRKAADTTGSQIVLELRNLREDNSSVEPLKGLKVDGIAFSLNGKILKVASEQINAALTYEQLRTAVEARIAELVTGEPAKMPSGLDGESTNPADYAALATFSVTLGGDFTATNESGNIVSGKQIVLTDSAGQEIEPITTTDAPGLVVGTGFTLYGELKSKGADSVAKSISTNLDADNVGYGSQGASVNIAGQSASNKGIEELNVKATNGVWFTKLQSLKSTHHLETINLTAVSNNYFRVGTQENSPNHVVSLVDQDFNNGGLVDVQKVEAGNAGETAINSFVSKDVLNRYNFKDTGNFDADESNITYNLSSGKDVLNLAISTDVLEAVDTQVNVNTGAGDDVITVQATKGLALGGKVGAALKEVSTGNGWLINQQLNNNIKIDAGAGNDWILTPGAGNATILAGAGDDVVRVDNAGGKAVFVFNNATTDVNELVAGAGYNQGLTSNSKNDLSAGANGIVQTQKLFKANVKVTFKGFESKPITIDSTHFTTSTKQINQAIKEAINEDPVLKNLITAFDNEGNALAIESQIDGTINLADLKIEIIPPHAYSTVEADIKAAKDAGAEMLSADDLTNADKAYKLAEGVTPFSDLATNASAAEVLYATEYGTSNGIPAQNAAKVTTQTEGVAAVAAAVAEVQTITFTGLTAPKEGGTITVGGVSVTLAPKAADYTDAEIATAVTTAIYADQGFDATGTAVAGTPAKLFAPAFGDFNFATAGTPAAGDSVFASAGVITFTYSDDTTPGTAEGDVAPIVVNTNGLLNGQPSVIEATKGAKAATAVHEVQIIDLSDVTVQGGETLTFTSAGLAAAVTYTNGTAGDPAVTGTALATAVQALITADANASAVVSASGTSVEVTFDTGANATGVNVAEIVVTGTGNGTAAIPGTPYNGSNSGAESDNVINLGTGQDLLVLGTGALSNDTVKIEGYNLGENTIVNFTAAGTPSKTTGTDLLDFSSYLTSVDANGAVDAKTVITGGNFGAANQVNIVDFNSGTALKVAGTAVTFDSLTASNVKAMINGTMDADNVFGNLNINTAAGAVGSTSHYVLLVQNNDNGGVVNNNGEYKAFHVTSTGTETDAADVKLIGTFDFGATLTGFDANNLA